MKHLSIIWRAALGLCLGLTLVLSGCQSAAVTTNQPPATQPATTPFKTTTPLSVDSRITILPCQDDPEGDIHFDGVMLTSGYLVEDYMSLQSGVYHAGEPCYLISGRIWNSSKTRYWVAYHAYGYDSSGNQVALTMDRGPIYGVAQTAIEEGNTEEFTLHLSWSDNVVSFKLFSQKSAQMFP